MKLLSPHIDAKQPGHAAAANSLLARAKAALATLKVEEANVAEQAALNKSLELRGKLDEWLVQKARADSLVKFDPSKSKKEIDASIAALTRQIGEAQAQRTAADGAVAALKAKSDGLLAQAKALREQASAVKARVNGASATEGLTLVQQAAEIGRRADALDKEASFVQADAMAAQPAADDAAARLVKLSNELNQAKTADAELAAITKATREQAEAARAQAEGAAAATAKGASELEALHAPEAALATALDGAVKGFKDAIASAGKSISAAGGGEAGGAAKLAKAGYQQALGDALYARTRGMQDYLAILGAMANSKPALPDAAKYADVSKSVSEAAAAALKDAQEAYEAAKDAYAAGGGKEEVRAKLEKLAALVGKMGVKKEEAAPVAPAAAPTDGAATEGAKDAAAAAAAPLEGDPVAAVKALFARQIEGRETADEAKVLATFANLTSTQRDMVVAQLRMGAAAKDLDVACTEKLGKGLVQLFKEAGPQGAMLKASVEGMAPTLDAMEFIAVSSTEVKVQVQGTPMAYSVKLADGVWKSEFPALPPGVAEQVSAMAPKLVSAFQAVAADVRAGTIADGKALASAFMSRFMAATAPPPDMNK